MTLIRKHQLDNPVVEVSAERSPHRPVDHFQPAICVLSGFPWFNHSMFIKLRGDSWLDNRLS